MGQRMREFRVTSCWFGKTVEEVERRRFVKLKRCVLEPAARGFKANPAADYSATQFQQQHKIQQQREIQQQPKFSSDANFTKKLEFLDAKQDRCTESFIMESRRVQQKSYANSRFRATRFSPAEFKDTCFTSDLCFVQVLCCTDISIVIWVYGIFRTLGYLV
ncbi:hypothetical protein F511_42299 [Dorcoceras hygrometricum]|uniref:Uncharacterized protein n=1 Tax=Dorcoceras hygrometricum TaxID=472368 RepID=A0A2Z7CD02_9LAMI|nr:hypothetical protein F511_42299 [Dorcoceras hygrometricum]